MGTTTSDALEPRQAGEQKEPELPYDLRSDFDKDFWFPITLPEAIPGSLWTSGCPRDVSCGSTFPKTAGNNKLDKVLCLLESFEDEQYAGVNLDQWYKTIGIEMERFPITDYSVPKSEAKTVDLIKRLLSDLQHGKRILMHCAGGTGRTGLLLLALYRLLGIQEPLKKLRCIKSRYVETAGQEKFGFSLEF